MELSTLKNYIQEKCVLYFYELNIIFPIYSNVQSGYVQYVHVRSLVPEIDCSFFYKIIHLLIHSVHFTQQANRLCIEAT